jgi:hypothetical protein
VGTAALTGRAAAKLKTNESEAIRCMSFFMFLINIFLIKQIAAAVRPSATS